MTAKGFRHETLNFTRVLQATTVQVFEAFRDPEARSKWAPPGPGDVLIFDQASFRANGLEIARCGPKDNPEYVVRGLYHFIEENRRILQSESVEVGGACLSASLNAISIRAVSEGAELTVVVQATTCLDDGMIEGYRQGWTQATTNLDNYLRAQAPV